MPPLEHCDDLFLRYFDRWYSDADRHRRGFQGTKPDMFTAEQLVGVDGPQVAKNAVGIAAVENATKPAATSS